MVISVLNLKGGVAKTVTVINLAVAFMADGDRVQCIDIDKPQFNLTDDKRAVAPSRVLTPSQHELSALLEKTFKGHTLIDCPPRWSASEPAAPLAILHSDIVLIPIAPTKNALGGAYGMTELLADYRERNERLKIKYYISRNKSIPSARRIREEARAAFGDDLLPVIVNEHGSFEEAAELGQSIIKYAPKSAGAQSYIKLAQELKACL